MASKLNRSCKGLRVEIVPPILHQNENVILIWNFERSYPDVDTDLATVT